MAIKTIRVADKPTLDEVKTNIESIKNITNDSSSVLNKIEKSTDTISSVIGHPLDAPNIDTNSLFSKINSLLDVKGSISIVKYGLTKPRALHETSNSGTYSYSVEILDNILYIIYGRLINSDYINSYCTFDLDKNSMVSITLSGSFPKSKVGSHVVYNNKIYLFFNNQAVYTIENNKIVDTGISIPSQYYSYNSFVYNGQLYTAIAKDDSSNLLLYKLNGTSFEKTNITLLSKFNNGKFIVFNNFIYFIDSTSSKNAIVKFNLDTGQTERSLPVTGGAAYFVLNNLIYVFPSKDFNNIGYYTIDKNDNVLYHSYDSSVSISSSTILQSFVYNNRCILFNGYSSSSNGEYSIYELGYTMNLIVPKSFYLYTDHTIYPEINKNGDGAYVVSETTKVHIGDFSQDDMNMTVSK